MGYHFFGTDFLDQIAGIFIGSRVLGSGVLGSGVLGSGLDPESYLHSATELCSESQVFIYLLFFICLVELCLSSV